VLYNGESVSRAQSWRQRFAGVGNLTRLSLLSGAWQVRGSPLPLGRGGRPWRLILSWLGGLLLLYGWLLEILPGTMGGGFGGWCWIPGLQGGWDRSVVHLGGHPSGLGPIPWFFFFLFFFFFFLVIKLDLF